MTLQALRDTCVGLAQLLSNAMSDAALAEQVDVDPELRAALREAPDRVVRSLGFAALAPIDIQREIPASWRLRRARATRAS